MTNLGPEESWPLYCPFNVRINTSNSTSSSLRRAHASVSERNQDIILGCALRAFAFAISEKFNCSQLRIVCRNTSRSSGSPALLNGIKAAQRLQDCDRLGCRGVAADA